MRGTSSCARLAVARRISNSPGRFGIVTEQQPVRSTFAGWMGSMWLYTTLRFGLFFALWGLLFLFGLHGFGAPISPLARSLPLSLVLLPKPRAAFTRQLEARVENRRIERQELDSRLESDTTDD